MSDESTNTPTTPSSFKFDLKRWTKTDRNVGIATLVFFISLFLPWFGISIFTVDGLWHGYMYLALIVSLALIIYLVMLAGLEKLPFRLPVAHAQGLFIATGFDFVLTLISFLTKPGGTSWQYGAYVGLIATIVAVLPYAGPAIRARTGSKTS